MIDQRQANERYRRSREQMYIGALCLIGMVLAIVYKVVDQC